MHGAGRAGKNGFSVFLRDVNSAVYSRFFAASGGAEFTGRVLALLRSKIARARARMPTGGRPYNAYLYTTFAPHSILANYA